MAKWPNHLISGKQFQKGQMATLLQNVPLGLNFITVLRTAFMPADP